MILSEEQPEPRGQCLHCNASLYLVYGELKGRGQCAPGDAHEVERHQEAEEE